MEDATPTSYTYKRLDGKRDLRLITLLQGSYDDPITLAIEHTSLELNPTYEALSYVWGQQYPSYPVRCDDGVIAIGENLKLALQQLRKLDASRVLWIDRIAINQEDVDERTQQVNLMADIYSTASIVIVWLGPSTEDTKLAFDFLKGLALQTKEFWKAPKSHHNADAKNENSTIEYPPSNASGWSAVRALLQRPWFSRVWTFQEIVLAKEAVLVCGAHTIQWSSLEVYMSGQRVYSPGSSIEDSRLKFNEPPLGEILKARVALHRSELHEPVASEVFLSLFPLLESLRSHQATDPRDKVFALLNVAIDTKRSGFKADYRKSPTEVYAITAKWLVRTQKSLAVLSLVEKKDKPDWISWVPDLRYKDKMNFLHQPLQVFRGKYRIFNAAGNTVPPFDEVEPIYQLTVCGIYVGTVVDTTEAAGNLINNVGIGARVLDEGQWHHFARSCAMDGIYPAIGEPIDLAYHRLRIWDRLPSEDLMQRRYGSPPTQIPQPGPLSYDSAKNGLVHGASGDIEMSILRATTRKKMFKTDNGYMGLAHRSVEIGDKVYVLMGGELPYVLRPLGGGYFGFGGESYVHGIMDGEILALTKAQREGLDGSDHLDLAWIDTLGDKPWPFHTEEMVLV